MKVAARVTRRLEVPTKELLVGDLLVNLKVSTSWSRANNELGWKVVALTAAGAKLERVTGEPVGTEPFTTTATWRVERTVDCVDRLAKDLKVGDEVWGTWDGASWFMYSGRYEVERHAHEVVYTKELEGGIGISLDPTKRMLVARFGSALVVPTTASPWNGKCPRCGMGTYTGFSNMEHEGGSCG